MRIAIILLLLTAPALAYDSIPAPCIELAQAHNKPLPMNEREARRARWEVGMRSLLGDPLAKQCERAIRAQRRHK